MASLTTTTPDESTRPRASSDSEAASWDGWFAKFEGIGLAKLDDEGSGSCRGARPSTGQQSTIAAV